MQDQRYLNKDAEYMSAEQLKAQFYEYFRESGTFSDLCAQLRSKLVNEMFKVASVDRVGQKDNPESSLLHLQVSNWLVYDHLKRSGYEYSLSTFSSEANLPYPKNLLSIKDILHLFEIEEHSSDYETIHSSYTNNNKDSFLYTFLSIISKKKVYETSNKEVLSKKEDGEQSNGNKAPSVAQFNPTKVFNNIFNPISPVNEVDVNETSLYRQLQLEKDKHEREIQQLRQKLLRELDNLYAQEQQARLELEQRKLKLVHEQEVLDLQKEKVQSKMTELNGKLMGLDLEAEEKVKPLKENLLQKQKELETWEAQLNEKQQKIEKEPTEDKSKGSQSSEILQQQFSQLQQSYKSLQDEYSSLLQKNERLQIEMKQFSDYSILKEELVWKSKKLEHFDREIQFLRAQMQEEKITSLNTIQRLQQQLLSGVTMQPYSVLPQPAEVGGNALHSQKPPLSRHEEEAKQRYEELLQKIEEQRNDIQELHRLIHNLHYQRSPEQKVETSRFASHQEPETEPKVFASSITSEIHEKYTKDMKQRIDDLMKQTDAAERKYAECMLSQPRLVPNIHIPYGKTLAYFTDAGTSHSKASLLKRGVSNSAAEFDHMKKSFRKFDLEFGSKIGYDHYALKPSELSSYSVNRRVGEHSKTLSNIQYPSISSGPLDFITSAKTQRNSLNSGLFSQLSRTRASGVTITESLNPQESHSSNSSKEGNMKHDNSAGSTISEKNVSVLNDHCDNVHNLDNDSIKPVKNLSDEQQISSEAISATVIRVSSTKTNDASAIGKEVYGNMTVANELNSLTNESHEQENIKPISQDKGLSRISLDASNTSPQKNAAVNLPLENQQKDNENIIAENSSLKTLSNDAVDKKIPSGIRLASDNPISNDSGNNHSGPLLNVLPSDNKAATSTPINDTVEVDLDAIWKQQILETGKSSISNINASTDRNEDSSAHIMDKKTADTVNDKNSENKVKRKLSFDDDQPDHAKESLTNQLPERAKEVSLSKSNEHDENETLLQQQLNSQNSSNHGADNEMNKNDKEELKVPKSVLPVILKSEPNPPTEKETTGLKVDTSDTVKPNSNAVKASVSAAIPTAVIRNSLSEISSSELDEKEGSYHYVSEQSEFHLSAGSELEEVKEDQYNDDGW